QVKMDELFGHALWKLRMGFVPSILLSPAACLRHPNIHSLCDLRQAAMRWHNFGQVAHSSPILAGGPLKPGFGLSGNQ
ncbi:MAG TPA: hypothetical protein VJ756_20080, partial [Terriglobales bacterium]|nr:hypothetical protein [Terriglobales bacterium]